MKKLNLITSVAVVSFALLAGQAIADDTNTANEPEAGMHRPMHKNGMMGKGILDKLSESDQNSCKVCFSAMDDYRKANPSEIESSINEFKKANKIDDDAKLSDEQKGKLREFMKDKMADKLKETLAEFKKEEGIKDEKGLNDEQVLKFHEYLREKMKDARPERGSGRGRGDMPPRPPMDDDSDE